MTLAAKSKLFKLAIAAAMCLAITGTQARGSPSATYPASPTWKVAPRCAASCLSAHSA